MEVPPFAELLRRCVDQQKREVAGGEDDLTRLVYWYAGKSFDQMYGGEAPYDGRRLRKRGAEPDQIIQALAPLVGIPPQYVAGRVWRLSDIPLVDETTNRSVLGPYHLFDDKSQFAAAFAYIVDFPVKKPGMIVEFSARIAAKYVKDTSASSSTAPLSPSAVSNADDGYVCIVVGKRPGDTIVRMKDEAAATGNASIKLFDRVMIRGHDVFRKRNDLMHSKQRKERAEEYRHYSSPKHSPQSSTEVTTASPEGGGGTPTKKPKLELTPSVIAQGVTITNSTIAAVRSVPKLIGPRTQPGSSLHNENIHGVVVKVYTPAAQKRRVVVIRMDTILGGPTSEHSQLIELDTVPQDDPCVLEFPEDIVVPSNEPLSLLDHQFTITRTAPIPPFNYSEARITQTRPLELAIFPGERVGVARHCQLGFAWSHWQDFDRQTFNYYYASKAILPREGSVLGTLTHELNARPAFNFKVTTLDSGSPSMSGRT